MAAPQDPQSPVCLVGFILKLSLETNLSFLRIDRSHVLVINHSIGSRKGEVLVPTFSPLPLASKCVIKAVHCDYGCLGSSLLPVMQSLLSRTVVFMDKHCASHQI